MNAKKLQLPNFLIADLYKNSLVDVQPKRAEQPSITGDVSFVTANDAKLKIDFLGDNSKAVTVIVNDETAKYLNEVDFTFLLNILKACNLAANDIAIVNYANQKVNLELVKEQLTPKVLLLFGVSGEEVQLSVPCKAFVIENDGPIQIMCSPALSEMNTSSAMSIQLKRQLWTVLKKMFEI